MILADHMNWKILDSWRFHKISSAEKIPLTLIKIDGYSCKSIEWDFDWSHHSAVEKHSSAVYLILKNLIDSRYFA